LTVLPIGCNLARKLQYSPQIKITSYTAASITQTIDSLHVVGDKAIVVMSQHLDRLALGPDNQLHHVETSPASQP
jgi:hypothetical protein